MKDRKNVDFEIKLTQRVLESESVEAMQELDNLVGGVDFRLKKLE